MKTITTFKIIIASICLAASISTLSAQTLIAGWDFQTTTNGGSQIVAAPSTQTSFPANFGTGTLYLDGTNGSSIFYSSFYELLTSTGVGYNLSTGDGFSTTTTSPASLVISRKTIANPVSDTNGKSIVFKFSMTGYDYVNISYGILRQNSAVGASDSFTQLAWSYSTDGTNWTLIENYDLSTLYSATLNYAAKAVTIPSNSTNVTALQNATTAYLKMTVSGGATSQSIRLDNIKIKAGTNNATGLNTLNENSSMSVSASNGIITMKTDSATPYQIYSVDGQLLANGVSKSGINQMSVASKGVALVKAMGHISKIIL